MKEEKGGKRQAHPRSPESFEKEVIGPAKAFRETKKGKLIRNHSV